jgi:hypothetical protein
MRRTLIGIAATLALAGITATTAYAENVTIPIKCKSTGYPGPRLINDTGKVIPAGKRLRWWKTESGPGNSTGQITLTKDLKPGAYVVGSDDIGGTACKAEVDKKRPDLGIKNVWLPEPGKVKVKVSNGNEWGTNRAQVSVDIFKCGAEDPTFSRLSKEMHLDPGEVRTLTFEYDAFNNGEATVSVTADPKMKVDEVNEWNNPTGASTCPCGGGQVCDAAADCSGGHSVCDDGCCEMLPPG